MIHGSTKSNIVRTRIRERLAALNLSPNRVSQLAGKDRAYLRGFLNGQGGMTTDTLAALAAVLQCTPAYLRGETDRLSGDAEVSPTGLRIVPIVGEVESGAFRPVEWYNGVNLGDIALGDTDVTKNRRLFAYNVRGDSMDLAGIVPGSQVVCLDPWEHGIELTTGTRVVVERRANGTRELTVKEVTVTPTDVELRPMSSNPRHEVLRYPKDYDLSGGNAEVAVVGAVVKIVSESPVTWGVRTLRKVASRAAMVALTCGMM